MIVKIPTITNEQGHQQVLPLLLQADDNNNNKNILTTIPRKDDNDQEPEFLFQKSWLSPLSPHDKDNDNDNDDGENSQVQQTITRYGAKK